ncbi:hypothetical protein [Streptomyces sp. NBRC 110611]|uniref:hypothetical protein n=1 Tax=Streptomyces sp. NBRC 110611 TaxID=1621259 RepID=UPI0011BDAB6C|nr:hypothetical protein [Streptomyces sp. NBRC 110611]
MGLPRAWALSASQWQRLQDAARAHGVKAWHDSGKPPQGERFGHLPLGALDAVRADLGLPAPPPALAVAEPEGVVPSPIPAPGDGEVLENVVLTALGDRPGLSKTGLRAAVTGAHRALDAAVARLVDAGQVERRWEGRTIAHYLTGSDPSDPSAYV